MPGLCDEGREQALDLVAVSGISLWWVFAQGLLGGEEGGEEGVGEHGEGDPAVPRGPASDLVFVETGQGLGSLERLPMVHRRPATMTKVVSGVLAVE